MALLTRERARRWLRVGLGVLFAIALFELARVRLWRLSYGWDPELGVTLAANRRFALWGEGYGSGWISDRGMRISPAPPAPSAASGGPRTLLVLGDSFAQAMQVDDDELFSNRMAAELSAGGLDVRAVNSGRAAYSMADYVCRADVLARAYRPDWILVQVNDADFSGDPFAPQLGHAGFRSGEAGLECVSPVIPPPPPVRGPARALVHAIRVGFGFPDAILGKLAERVAREREGPPLFSAGWAESRPAAEAPPPVVPVEAELALLAGAWDRRITLFYHPDFVPDDLATATPMESRIAAAARDAGVRFRSLREEFPELARRRRVPYGFANSRLNAGHWNADGHAAAARVLAREMREIEAHGLL